MSDVSCSLNPSRNQQNMEGAGENLGAATAFARLTVSELVRAGVRDFVICPGSRSAPLTYALAALAQAGTVRTHVRLDERSAAFFALGLAKSSIYKGEDATYTPVALVVTSGTAVAELHAGLLEAFHCGIPLIALTADRPRTARGTGANQTTWQQGIFGAACPVALDIDASEDDLDTVKESLSEAFEEAWGAGAQKRGRLCPLQLNLCFAPPLVSSTSWQIPAELQGLALDEAAIAASLEKPLKTQVVAEGADEAPRKIAKTLVVLADQCPPQVAQAAQKWGLPVLAEPTVTLKPGNVVQIAHAPQVLPALAGEIEQIILAGHATLSRPISALLSREDIPIYCLPSLGAKTNLTGKYMPTTTAQVDTVFPAAASPAWLARWREVAQAVERAYRRGVDRRAVTVWQNANYAAFDPGDLPQVVAEGQTAPSINLKNHGFATSDEEGKNASEAAHRLRMPSPEGAPELRDNLRELEMGIDPFALARIYEDVYEAWVNRDPDSARNGDLKADNARNSADSARGAGSTGSLGGVLAQPDGKKVNAAGAPPLTMLGASNTIRAFDLAARGDRGISYCANRGLAGIDGNIATALGLAAGTGQAVRFIAGDLTCLHDLTGLLTGQLEDTPTVQVMVLNDGGGRIFATLEHGELANPEVFERYFLTPQRFDLSALAAGLGWDYRCAQDIEELKMILCEDPRREIVEINAYLPDLRARRAALESEIRRELADL
ncbi:thiamine pyrophosphate-binding protein [Varibaculum cambriense]|uniref:thiamine pyrophosphate-binding protein n=1 Tax=Varibaculum cambriense TaxID=184870 RepID=UPI002901E3FB|nr:thiamine pyrophosphate-binding protein [Varibaculum cambriense]MDU1223775.1 thiamine pyrophosphate-binding protein [Varibaculum cambriense]